MIHKAVSTVMQKLIHAGMAIPSQSKGCAKSELQTIESTFDIRLPLLYREFLLAMGHSSGEFLVGSDYRLPALLEFRTYADPLLSDDSASFELATNDFVFFFHQGYSFLYFACQDSDDDPPVFMYTENAESTQRIADSFSQWLNLAADSDIEMFKSLNK